MKDKTKKILKNTGLFAAAVGIIYGVLLNAVKGSEMMIATYVGFAFVSLMCSPP